MGLVMSEDDLGLTAEQQARKKQLELYSTLIGVAVAVVVSGVGWLLIREAYPYLRYFYFMGVGLGSFFLAYVASHWLMAASARCNQCSALYSVSMTDKQERYLSSTPRHREVEAGRSISGPNEGKRLIRKISWTETRYEVSKTYVCTSCGDTRVQRSTRTSKENEHSDDVYRR